eukprot:m.87014 g.87014  ORF g.87014 m.87014 type:complete len:142 (+) comp8780_c0_seq2:627-1052(+)
MKAIEVAEMLLGKGRVNRIMSIDLHVDFEGQKLVDMFVRHIVEVFGFIGLLVGFFMEDFGIAVKVWLIGLVVAVLICVPPWWFFRKHPLQWLSVEERTKNEKKARKELKKQKSKKKSSKRKDASSTSSDSTSTKSTPSNSK